MNIRPKTTNNVLIILIGVITLSSCASKRFSHKFMDRYISDSSWLFQLNYVPACNFTLQASKRNIDFSKNASGHFIYRKRDIDEFVFTPLSTGVLRKFHPDTVWIQFATESNSILKFVRDTKEDEYFLSPDTIINERFVIRYLNRVCISEKKLPEIKLNVQGIEITKVQKNKRFQKGIKPEQIYKSDTLTSE